MSNNEYESLIMENSSLNKLYKNTLNKMKKMQSEYESMYLQYLNENQQRENTLKNNYSKYQDLLQKQYKKEEKNYLNEINLLKLELNEKNMMINNLQKDNSLLKDKIAKNDLIFQLKEKEYQKELLNKDRLLMKSSNIVKKNSKEVMEDIQKLKEELKYFQNKIYIMNNATQNQQTNNNVRTINSNSNINYYNSELSNANSINNCICNCHCHQNSVSELNKSFYSMKYPDVKNNKILSGKKKIGDSYEIYYLKNKIKHLNYVIKKKDEEILFWKNVRKDIYFSNYNYNNFGTENFDDVLNNFKIEFEKNKKNLIRNLTHSNKKNYRRSYSQSSSHFRPYKNNMKLNLFDSNVNKPINSNNVSKEEKKK